MMHACGHLAHIGRNTHEALRPTTLLLIEFASWIQDIIRGTKTFYVSLIFFHKRHLAFLFHCIGKDILCGILQELESFPMVVTKEYREVQFRKHFFEYLQFVGKNLVCHLQVFLGCYVAAISLHSFLHLLSDAQIVDDDTKFLVLVLTVYTAYGLYQGVLAQWFVIVEHGKAWYIEACNPHIYHNGDMKVGLLRLKLGVQKLTMRLVAQGLVEFLVIIVSSCANYVDVCYFFELVFLLGGQGILVESFLLLKPSWFYFSHCLVKFVGYLAVGTSHHGFL